MPEWREMTEQIKEQAKLSEELKCLGAWARVGISEHIDAILNWTELNWVIEEPLPVDL